MLSYLKRKTQNFSYRKRRKKAVSVTSKKAQSLSLNAIVIGALALVVLLTIVLITTGYFGTWQENFTKATDATCTGAGGTSRLSCQPGETTANEPFDDVKKGEVCCVKSQSASTSAISSGSSSGSGSGSGSGRTETPPPGASRPPEPYEP